MIAFKKYLVIPLALMVVILMLSGCGSSQSEKVVKDFYAAIKAKDYNQAATMVDKNTNKQVPFAKSIAQDKSSADIILAQVTYKIVKSDQKANRATVHLTVTQVDYTTIFNDKLTTYMQNKILNDSQLLALSDEEAFQKIVLPYLKEKINSRTPRITSKAVINLKKVNDKWLIQDDEELEKAVLGNYNEAINLYQNY